MDSEHQFEAVLFDLDDTLFSSSLMSYTARRNAIRAIQEAGIELDEDETFEMLLEIVKKYGSNYGEHFNRLIEELGFEVHPKLIAAAIVAYHSSKQALLRPFPGVILTLLTLMKSVKIGVITDGIKIKQWEKLFYLGIQHFFDVVIVNDLPSQWKPSDNGYKLAMKQLKLKDASKIIYVGNKIETDIIGANKMGMTSILFDPKKKIPLESLSKIEMPNHTLTRFQDVLEIVGLKSSQWRF